jgi:hypothetical protein
MAAMCDGLFIVEYVVSPGRRVFKEARNGDNMGIESRKAKLKPDQRGL